MPREGPVLPVADPYAHSMQWSRRFIGLKLFLSLAVAGWEGYAEAIRQQTAMGDRLRERLRAEGWAIVNDTPLPVVCFVDSEAGREGRSRRFLEAVAADVVASGEAWISTVALGEGGPPCGPASPTTGRGRRTSTPWSRPSAGRGRGRPGKRDRPAGS